MKLSEKSTIISSFKTQVYDVKDIFKASIDIFVQKQLALNAVSLVSTPFVITELSPQAVKRIDGDFVLVFGIIETIFGWCFLARAPQGICKIAFYDTEQEAFESRFQLFKEWPVSKLKLDQIDITSLAQSIFSPIENLPLSICLVGTAFQFKVWQSLLRLGKGRLRSYEQIAEIIGHPNSTRAVASAIAKNQLAYLIPCHRIIRKNGDFGEYRWGRQRKCRMIEHEFNLSMSAVGSK